MQAIYDTRRPPGSVELRPPTIGGWLRGWLSGRRGLVVAAVAVTGGGLALGWNWLAAVGVAPLLLSLAPCAAMCALGWCMMPKTAQSPAVNAEDSKNTPPTAPADDRQMSLEI